MKNIILLFVLAASVSVTAQGKGKTKASVANGKLSGVVTYTASRSAGEKADIGAEVIIIKSDVKANSPQDIMGKFTFVRLLQEVYSLTKEAEYLAKLQKANADTSEKFEVIDNAAVEYYFKQKYDKKNILTKVDATGRYTADLKPGRYEVIIRSKGLPDINSTMEIEGMVYNYFIDVKSGQTTSQDHSFKK